MGFGRGLDNRAQGGSLYDRLWQDLPSMRLVCRCRAKRIAGSGRAWDAETSNRGDARR